MINTRRYAFLLSAVMFAGFAMSGCSEEETHNGGNGGGGSTCTGDDCSNVDCTGQCCDFCNGKGCSSSKSVCGDDYSKADKVCKSAKTCPTDPKCADGLNYKACECVTDKNTCQSDPKCKGIGTCDYECGVTDGSCSFKVCKGHAACKDTCDKNTLPLEEDFDGDGISNGDEITGDISDPCKKDTDGDGLDDGEEDLNHNGIYEPELGETNPQDPASFVDKKSATYLLKQAICQADDVLKGSSGSFKNMRVAKLEGATYTPDSNDQSNITIFDDPKHKVVGFFGSGLTFGGQLLLKSSGLPDGSAVEESNFTSEVPLTSWKETEVYDSELQIVPDHTVARYKYSIDMTYMENKTLEGVRNQIAKKFGDVTATSGNTTCDDNKAILYLARSQFTNGSSKTFIYSGALTCASTKASAADNNQTSIEAMNILEDVISGTLISPTKSAYANAPTGGYLAFETFVCQAEAFGSAAGMVDFLWVIDNSGSMKDELDNLANTVAAFSASLANTSIDYRIAVTTTDAYLLDEWADSYSPTTMNAYYQPYDEKMLPNGNAYLNGLGIRNVNKSFPGFFININIENKPNANNPLYMSITYDTACVSRQQKNICGKGYEDGFKSGAFALSRLAIKTEPNAEQPILPEADSLNLEKLKLLKENLASEKYLNDPNGKQNETNYKRRMEAITLRDDALKYIIWVSDEESRQFKEERKVSEKYDNLVGCLTGYLLKKDGDQYSMLSGQWSSSYSVENCNPSIKESLEKNINDYIKDRESPTGLSTDSSLEEIEARNPAYYDMLQYYIGQYRHYAGNNDVTGFALVGDIGNRNGGICKTLKLCDGTCILDDMVTEVSDTTAPNYSKSGGGFTECFDCRGNWIDSADATTGANYGLSYIHLARFLSKNKEGGFASICNSNFETSVNAIFEDVAGRIASHPLKGYPIASTIRVAITSNGKVVELTRGASKNGWSYDASQNAIVFSGISATGDDFVAISYVIWKENNG